MRGFTAVEVLLVVAILGVLGLAAISFLPSAQATRLRSAAEQVRSDIEYARENAMTTGQTSGVQFINNSSYTVYQGTPATPLLNPLTRQDMVVTLSSSYPGVSVSGNYTVEFGSLGSPTTGGGGSITLTSSSLTKIISVTANTGRVVLQ